MTTNEQERHAEWLAMAQMPESMTVGELNAAVRFLRERLHEQASIAANPLCPDHWHCDPVLAAHACWMGDRSKPCPSCGVASPASAAPKVERCAQCGTVRDACPYGCRVPLPLTCTWPGCAEPALCRSGNFNDQLVCSTHFQITNGDPVTVGGMPGVAVATPEVERCARCGMSRDDTIHPINTANIGWSFGSGHVAHEFVASNRPECTFCNQCGTSAADCERARVPRGMPCCEECNLYSSHNASAPTSPIADDWTWEQALRWASTRTWCTAGDYGGGSDAERDVQWAITEALAEIERLRAQGQSGATPASDGEGLKGLNDDPNAQRWAREFCKLNTASDEGTMLGWFANAIMCGYDHHARSVPPALDLTTSAFGVSLKATADEIHHCNECSAVRIAWNGPGMCESHAAKVARLFRVFAGEAVDASR